MHTCMCSRLGAGADAGVNTGVDGVGWLFVESLVGEAVCGL
jgi:hypothetical protein